MNGNHGAARLHGVLAQMIHTHTDTPDVLELGEIQQGMALLCDHFRVPLPQGEYLRTSQVAALNPPLAPGDVVLVAWVNRGATDHTDVVIIDRVVTS